MANSQEIESRFSFSSGIRPTTLRGGRRSRSGARNTWLVVVLNMVAMMVKRMVMVVKTTVMMVKRMVVVVKMMTMVVKR